MDIACETCGATQESTAHLARHLRDMHGWHVSLAIQLAKEMRGRYQDKDEYIRQAAPDMLACLEVIAGKLPAETYMGERNIDAVQVFLTAGEIAAIRVVIAKARGASIGATAHDASIIGMRAE